MFLDGWVGGWMGGWVGVKTVLRIAYSNQKASLLIFFCIFKSKNLKKFFKSCLKSQTGGSATLPNGGGIQVVSNIITNIYYHGIVVGNILLTDELKLNPLYLLNNRLMGHTNGVLNLILTHKFCAIVLGNDQRNFFEVCLAVFKTMQLTT
jgi:hypothetical protein